MTIRFLAEFLGSVVFTTIVNSTSYHFGYGLSAIIVIVSGIFSFITMRVRNKNISA